MSFAHQLIMSGALYVLFFPLALLTARAAMNPGVPLLMAAPSDTPSGSSAAETPADPVRARAEQLAETDGLDWETACVRAERERDGVPQPQQRPEPQPDRCETVPAMCMGQVDAELRVFSADGETADMALCVLGETVARGSGFNRPQIGPYTWFDVPTAELLGTFGAFLSHALESSEPDARDGWPVLTDAAADWTDALLILGEPADADGAE